VPQTPLGELTVLPQTHWLDLRGLTREGEGVEAKEGRGGEERMGGRGVEREGRGVCIMS